MGAIFNYYGRRSICKMYATDYIDEADTSVIAGFISEDTVKALDAFMLGWLDTGKVSLFRCSLWENDSLISAEN